MAVAALAAQLHDRFVQEAETVQPAGRELPAVRVERQLAVERDPLAALDERPALAAPAEAERLEPRHREPAEAVVQLGDVDVAGAQIGARPHVRGGVACRHRRHVVPLVPRRPAPQRGADRFDACDRMVDRGRVLGGRHDHRGRPVDGNVAVEQAERGGDHAGREVVVDRHRVTEDRVRVAARVAAAR